MNTTALTLGDMLAFVGLIVAALALARPRYSLIWRATERWIKILAVTLLTIGYLAPLVSMLAPDVSNFWGGLSLQAFIQACGFVIISLGLLVIGFIFSRLNYRHLLTLYTQLKLQQDRYPKTKWRSWTFQLERRKIVTERSAKKFYNVCSIFVMRGHYEEVAEIVRMNIRPLVMSASQFDRYRSRSLPGQPNDVKLQKRDGSNFTFELLYQLLTDKAFMKHVVTNNRFFIHAVVEAEYDNNEYSYQNEFASILYPELLGHLMRNKDSFLYMQKETYNGSARFANVYELLTDENVIRRQRIFPGQLTWNHRKTDVPDDEYAEVLITLLELMIESYKEKPGNKDLLDNIRLALKGLVGRDGIVRYLAWDQLERKAYNELGTQSNVSKVLLHIHTAFSSRLLFNGEEPAAFMENAAELESSNHKSIYDEDTLTALMVHAVYELIEDYTVLFRDTDDFDGTLLRETMFFMDQSGDKPLALLFEKLLWERMFDKAVKGELEIATNISGHYPNMLRFIINYFVPFDSSYRLKHLSEEVEQLKRIMSNELKEALLAGKKMASGDPMKDELLPKNIKAVVSKKANTVNYYYINSRGERRSINLKEKPKTPIVEFS